MKTKTKPASWYAANTGNHQRLIIDENDGRSVAVAFDAADAPLLASAPDLLAALEALMETESELRDEDCLVMQQARAAILKAKGA